MHITSVALGNHCSDGEEHEAIVSPTRTRPVSQWYVTCAPTLELVNSLTLPLTGACGGEQPAEREKEGGRERMGDRGRLRERKLEGNTYFVHDC